MAATARDARAAAEQRRSERTRILKAMAHPSRLLVLETLASGERCVCELQELVGADMSTVSKHLALMREAGLVEDRRQGLQVFYRLRVPCVMRFFECLDAVRDEGPPVRIGAARRRASSRSGGRVDAGARRRAPGTGE
jgi:DNA-binding transcriptional ArsR family regulator